MKKTYMELLKEHQELTEKRVKVNQEMTSLSGYIYIFYALRKYDNAILNDILNAKTRAEYLIEELLDREHPMSYNDIEGIFKASGFEYVGRHISECCPDKQETIDAYNKEESYER